MSALGPVGRGLGRVEGAVGLRKLSWPDRWRGAGQVPAHLLPVDPFSQFAGMAKLACRKHRH